MKTKRSSKALYVLIATILCAVIAFSCLGCERSPVSSTPNNKPSVDAPTETPDDSDPDKNLDDSDSDKTPEVDDTETPEDGDSDKNPEDGQTPAWAQNFTLPATNVALTELNELYGGAEKVFILQNGNIARMPCPKGEIITFNMTYEVGEYARLVFEDSIAEFNEVFAVINPNYKFAINYSPTEEDFKAKYSVRMTVSDNLAVTETSQVFGVAHIRYYSGSELCDFGITLKTEILNNGSYLMTTFKHELMHLLGAGDAYKNPNATKDTIMQHYTVNGCHSLSQTDVAFLDIMYRNPELSADETLKFVNEYEQINTHTQSELTATAYRKLVNDLDPATVINQASEKGYKDITDFCEKIADGINRDVTFGETYASFNEVEYVERPDVTYFGRIDPQTGKYSHGVQTTLGNAQGFTYTDYGEGVLFASPNGNLYTILIRVNGYVLTFRQSGSFTNFSALSLSLWYICK